MTLPGRLNGFRGEVGEPMRLVLSGGLTLALGAWFLAANAAGEIVLRAGPRAARGVFSAERLTDPDQFYGGLIVIGVLFLAALASLFTTAWDLVVAARRGSGRA